MDGIDEKIAQMGHKKPTNSWFVVGQMIAPVVLREMAAHSPMDYKTPILTQVSTAYLLSLRNPRELKLSLMGRNASARLSGV